MHSNNINKEIQERIARQFLKFIVPTLIIGGLTALVGALITSSFNISRAIIALLVVLFSIPAYWFGKQSDYRKGMYFVIISLTVILTIGMILNGGVRSPAYLALVTTIAFISWISTTKNTIRYFVAVVLLGLISLIASHFNVLPSVGGEVKSLYIWITFTVTELVLVYTLVTGNSMLHKYLADSIEQEKLVSTTFTALDELLFIIDSNGKIVRENSATTAFLDSINWDRNISVFSLTFSIAGKALPLRSILTPLSLPKDMQIVHSKSERTFSLSAYLLDNNENCDTAILMSDITDRLKLETQLIEHQKMDAIGQLSSGIAHDFNNMLSGIVGSTELLSLTASENQKEFITIIENAADKASRLTQQLLLFGRKQTTDFATIDVHHIISDTFLLLTRTLDKKIILTTNLAAEHATVFGDDNLIQNALMNMGINASHAMPDGGTLSFSTKEVELDEFHCNHSPFELTPGSFLEISIQDSGTGIPPEVISKIFDPFFTTKEVGKGTGLGLAGVYAMVQKHSGEIAVYSEMGTGTIFRIYLPIRKENSSHTNSIDQTIIPGTGTILIADDEELVALTVSQMLESMGYTTFTASNGEEALSLLSENQIDLVILDMVMPIMNGKETFFRIKEHFPTLPVLLSSGFSKDNDVTEMRKSGLSGFIHKPYRRVELSRVVHETLKSNLQ